MPSKLQILAVFAAAATAWAAEDLAGVDVALAEDGECNADDEACALNALQQKALRASAKLHEQEEAEAESQTDACEGPISKWMKANVHDGAACLSTCPQMCGPLTSAWEHFVGWGNQPAFQATVCANVGAFECAYGKGKDVCQGVGALMASKNIDPPTSYSVLRHTCQTKFVGGR